jgi:hypothetical protein
MMKNIPQEQNKKHHRIKTNKSKKEIKEKKNHTNENQTLPQEGVWWCVPETDTYYRKY